MNFFKRMFVKFVSWFIQATKDLELPWVKQIMSGEQLEEITSLAKPGDILLVRAGGYFSTWLFSTFNLGTYTHAAFVSDYRRITDATRVGISERAMLSILTGYTHCALMRPKLSEDEMNKVWDKYSDVMKKDALENIKYNYELVIDGNGNSIPDSLTCSQFVRLLLNAGCKDFLYLKKSLGFMSISPQNIYDAKSKFDLIKKFD